jgi:hypothetical protein
MGGKLKSKKDLKAIEKQKANNEWSKETWKKMKAASSSEKNSIGTRVSIRAISTNIKN